MDERIAPAGDPDRNLTHLRVSLLEHSPLADEQIHAMPVEEADIEGAALRYARTLEQIAGTPPVPDLAHLGLGPDGHTASLVPNDPVLGVVDRDVALSGVYMKRPSSPSRSKGTGLGGRRIELCGDPPRARMQPCKRRMRPTTGSPPA